MRSMNPADVNTEAENLFYYSGLSRRNYPGLDYIAYDDGRESPYVIGRLAQTLGCPAAELALATSPLIPPEDREAVSHARAQAKKAGAESFAVKYRVNTREGTAAWVTNRAVRFVDENNCGGYIHFLADTTHEHELAEQVRLHMEKRLAETEKVFSAVAQHSDRILYAYDLKTGVTRPWDLENQKKDILAHLYTGTYSHAALDENPFVLPDSAADVKKFFASIHAGFPSGEVNVHVMLQDGQRRWYHFKYTNLFDNEVPVTALISIADVTERHQQELSHLRYVRAMGADAADCLSYMEADLTADVVERHAGTITSETGSAAGMRYSDFHQNHHIGLSQGSRRRADQLYSRDSLLDHYQRGVHYLDDIWEAVQPQGTQWVQVKAELLEDPFSRNTKLFATMTDVTAQQEALLKVHHRADFDTMTGLLRKDAGEERIRQRIASRKELGSILIMLDLDDLKSINDLLGHTSGDQAIHGISETLKGHFPQEAILVRGGGDEFMVYLSGADHSISSVHRSLDSLLRKLSLITVGEGKDRSIHCSGGCAVVQPGDTFETLFKRADIALYHVKRRGKNNFAFFTPEMLQADYEFRANQASPIPNETAREEELRHLLEIVAAEYPGIVHFNLTQNHFRLISVGSNVEESPPPGTIEAFWDNWSQFIHPEDLEGTVQTMGRAGLLSSYALGQQKVQHLYRNLEDIGYVLTEILAPFYSTATGDICAFLFFRWAPPPETEGEPG